MMRPPIGVAMLMLAGSFCCRAAPEFSAPTQLAVADSPETGRYVTDATGQALYALDKDTRDSSSCDQECARSWIPAAGSEKPIESSEPAIQSNLIGSIRRHDGTRQLTYGGWPLYYRRGDRAPSAEPSVIDRWGTWSLLFPHGERMVP